MSSNPATSIVKSKHGKCADIYADEIKKQINTLINFRETWLRSSADWNTNLFQYADPDFYFFRFAIDRQEKSTEPFLLRVLPRVMERYGIDFEIPDDTTFCFIINENGNRHGYRFKDFYRDQDVNSILFQRKIDDAFILSVSKPGRADDWIARDNEHYIANGLHLRTETLKSFFHHYFGAEEYNDFLQAIDQYMIDARENTGYKSIKFFSTMNLATQKAFEQKYLADWQYKNYAFQIIDPQNPRIKPYIVSPTLFSKYDHETMERNYISDGLYKSMIGSEEYAESFLTSEWLYFSLKELKHFDYTAVVCGYLKSVEQLLYKIVMLNVDNKNNYKITMNGAKDLGKEAYKNRVTAYKRENNGTFTVIRADSENVRKYIDLISSQVRYIDSTMGSFEIFLRNNPKVFVVPSNSKPIANLICCFREESRNVLLHIHNLKDWEIVEKIRSNAIFLYYVLLGGCIIPQSKISDLGFLLSDRFDELCKRLREFQHYNGEFIFEYADGKKLNLIYDFMNNTIQHNDEGVEHYESLVFYEVEQFGKEAYEQLDEGIRKDQVIYLTRNNLPSRIIGLYRDGRSEEIPIA